MVEKGRGEGSLASRLHKGGKRVWPRQGLGRRQQADTMARSSLAARLERRLTEEAGLYVVVEESDGAIVLSGRVDSPEACRAAEDIVMGIAPGARIDNNLEIEGGVP